MKEGQDEIFYVCGESKKQVESSPFLEALRRKDLEVLLMTDPIDEYSMQQLKEFDGKKFKNISKEGVSTATTDEEKTKALFQINSTHNQRISKFKIKNSPLPSASLHLQQGMTTTLKKQMESTLFQIKEGESYMANTM